MNKTVDWQCAECYLVMRLPDDDHDGPDVCGACGSRFVDMVDPERGPERVPEPDTEPDPEPDPEPVTDTIKEMTFNVFEGARRIVWIIAVLWVLVVCGYNLSDGPSVRLRYIVEGLDYVPIRMKDGADCSYDDAEEGRSLATDKGMEVWLSLCFKAHTSDSGEAGMIPYRKATNIEEAAFLEARFEKNIRPRINPKLVLEAKEAYLRENAGTILYMGKEGNPEVSAYTNRVAGQFALPDKDEEWADSQWWPELFKKIKNVVSAAVGGWVFLWLLTWVIGWVVRGFFGIPIGHDRRVDKGKPRGNL